MSRCCYKCEERTSDCHATCGKYAEEVAENEQRKEKIRQAKAGYREMRDYKWQHYKSVDMRNSRLELRGRKKW